MIERDSITIVSGLPRSGTSMMMSMLEAGGVDVLADGIRAADEDNPKGYYEFEQVKRIERDRSWLKDARGRAVKMVAALLKHLPPEYQYRVLFVRRNMDEVLASQHRMLLRRGEATDAVPDERMAELFEKHVAQVETWLEAQPNIAVLHVDYAQVLQDAEQQAQRIATFLARPLDVQAMAAVVDPSLYRQRQA